MKIGELMVGKVFTLRADDTLNEAARLFWEHDCGFLPVVDEDLRLVGVLTDRDVCLSAFFKGANLRSVLVSQAMARELVVARRSDSVEDVLELCAARQLRRVPVVDANGRLEGLFSISDAARAFARGADLKPKRIARVLAAVTEPRGSVAVALEIEVRPAPALPAESGAFSTLEVPAPLPRKPRARKRSAAKRPAAAAPKRGRAVKPE